MIKRMSTSGKDESYEHVLMCLICRSLFDDYDHQPKFLPCHHTFCKDCLREYVRQIGDEIECPSCRKIANVPAAGVAALQTNFYVKYIQSLVSGGAGVSSHEKDCSKHPSEKTQFYCQTCKSSICNQCCAPGSASNCSSHEKVLITRLTEETHQRLDAAFSQANATIEAKKVRLEKALKALAAEKDSALLKIESTFEQHAHTLSRRATLLKNKVIDIYNENVERLENDLMEISTALTCIVSLKDYHEDRISHGDYREFSKGIEEVQEVNHNISSHIQPAETHIIFEGSHGSEKFRAAAKDLGRVKFTRLSRAEPEGNDSSEGLLANPQSPDVTCNSPKVGQRQSISDLPDTPTTPEVFEDPPLPLGNQDNRGQENAPHNTGVVPVASDSAVPVSGCKDETPTAGVIEKTPLKQSTFTKSVPSTSDSKTSLPQSHTKGTEKSTKSPGINKPQNCDIVMAKSGKLNSKTESSEKPQRTSVQPPTVKPCQSKTHSKKQTTVTSTASATPSKHYSWPGSTRRPSNEETGRQNKSSSSSPMSKTPPTGESNPLTSKGVSLSNSKKSSLGKATAHKADTVAEPQIIRLALDTSSSTAGPGNGAVRPQVLSPGPPGIRPPFGAVPRSRPPALDTQTAQQRGQTLNGRSADSRGSPPAAQQGPSGVPRGATRQAKLGAFMGKDVQPLHSPHQVQTSGVAVATTLQDQTMGPPKMAASANLCRIPKPRPGPGRAPGDYRKMQSGQQTLFGRGPPPQRLSCPGQLMTPGAGSFRTNGNHASSTNGRNPGMPSTSNGNCSIRPTPEGIVNANESEKARAEKEYYHLLYTSYDEEELLRELKSGKASLEDSDSWMTISTSSGDESNSTTCSDEVVVVEADQTTF